MRKLRLILSRMPKDGRVRAQIFATLGSMVSHLLSMPKPKLINDALVKEGDEKEEKKCLMRKIIMIEISNIN